MYTISFESASNRKNENVLNHPPESAHRLPPRRLAFAQRNVELDVREHQVRVRWARRTARRRNKPMHGYILLGVPSGVAWNFVGAPASRMRRQSSRVVPDPKAEIASASEPRNAASSSSSTPSSPPPRRRTRRWRPPGATRQAPRPPPACRDAEIHPHQHRHHALHRVRRPASTSAASKSHALFVRARFVTPRTTTSTAGTDPRALNAGKSTRYSPSSIATVALCPVSAHCPSHGHSPMSKKGARYDCRVRHVPDVSNDRFKIGARAADDAPPRRP